VRTLTRPELTAALAARQGLIERRPLSPAEAIRRLTPLQGQHPPAPHIALAARLDGFTRADLEAALDARSVVKTTLLRLTLHLAAADDYPAYAQLVRQVRLRTWRKQYPHLDEERVTAELGAWLAEPRTNEEIRERVRGYEGVTDEPWTPIVFARVLLPLVQLPPAGHWGDNRRASFVVDPRPLPDPGDAAKLVLARYLAAFGPASRRDVAAWAGVPQRDFAAAWERLETVEFRDEAGTRLFDLPGQPLPPASMPLPPRFLAHWDQPLLAHADRERIIPPEVRPLKLTLSGDPTVTVDGRVAGSWAVEREGDVARLTVTPHVEISRAGGAEIRAEAERTARFCEPDARVEVAGVS
jgi:winged helix DNA-binding protein